ncbi:hypothetical protein RB653_008570 [Dictyostelium firmibasis]|uniref:Uncharacterized protein n=1 Tax=Dictyostelium firmibasis TaxID=79012 RepID=A0AAN7U4X4_9MYCE
MDSNFSKKKISGIDSHLQSRIGQRFVFATFFVIMFDYFKKKSF